MRGRTDHDQREANEALIPCEKDEVNAEQIKPTWSILISESERCQELLQIKTHYNNTQRLTLKDYTHKIYNKIKEPKINEHNENPSLREKREKRE